MTNGPVAQPDGMVEGPRTCDWCGVVPEVVRGAGYDYRVECQTETCIVQPSTVGIRGRQNAINAWNTRTSTPDSITEKARRVVEMFNEWLVIDFEPALTADKADALQRLVITEFETEKDTQ